jgi:hypothetical protein
MDFLDTTEDCSYEGEGGGENPQKGTSESMSKNLARVKFRGWAEMVENFGTIR